MFTKKINIYAIAALFIGVLFISTAAQAQWEQNTNTDSLAITGVVIDSETQMPVSEIELTLEVSEEDQASGNTEQSAEATEKKVQTNERGEFSFTGVEPGTYTITASPEGYQEVSKDVELTPSGITSVDQAEGVFTIKLTPISSTSQRSGS